MHLVMAPAIIILKYMNDDLLDEERVFNICISGRGSCETYVSSEAYP